jgi:hypothetical protein
MRKQLMKLADTMTTPCDSLPTPWLSVAVGATQTVADLRGAVASRNGASKVAVAVVPSPVAVKQLAFWRQRGRYILIVQP